MKGVITLTPEGRLKELRITIELGGTGLTDEEQGEEIEMASGALWEFGMDAESGADIARRRFMREHGDPE